MALEDDERDEHMDSLDKDIPPDQDVPDTQVA
jgi:hypothetical protein